MNPGMYSSARSEWGTPQALVDTLYGQFPFTLDVCATTENAKCHRYVTPEEDGLTADWRAMAGIGWCWMNPPYGRDIAKWVEKAARERERGAAIVALLPARTDTRWWQAHVNGCAELWFIRGRIKFDGAKDPAPFPSMLAVYWPERMKHETVRPCKVIDIRELIS